MMNIEQIKETYPEGTLIELEEMASVNYMPYGLKGTVTSVDDIGQIHMQWENGSSFALNFNTDSFRKIDSPAKIFCTFG